MPSSSTVLMVVAAASGLALWLVVALQRRGAATIQHCDIQGSYDEHRIVKFRDAAGRVQEIWAIVEFNNFHFSRIRWRAEQKDRLPPSILAILEN